LGQVLEHVCFASLKRHRFATHVEVKCAKKNVPEVVRINNTCA